MNSPYRTAEQVTPIDDTPETILTDTLRRLNNIDQGDAQRVVRSLAAFMGFNVGERQNHLFVDVVEDEADDDE